MVKATGFRGIRRALVVRQRDQPDGCAGGRMGLGTLIGEIGVGTVDLIGHDFRSYST